MSSCIAIIPARGGSKRIPKKNTKEFLGQPVIKYSIDAALDCQLFEEVMVSTDDQEIAEMSKKFGAMVPFMRSEKNADDYATTAEVLLEVLRKYLQAGKFFSAACCIYPTAPFVTAKKLKDAFILLNESDADSVIPVVKFSYPIQRAFKIESGELKRFWPEYGKSRSQDLEPAYHDVGQFYWFKTEQFLKRGSLKGDRTIPFIVTELEMQDLDNEEDWNVAEFKYRFLHH